MAANQMNGPAEPFGYKKTDEGLEPIPEQLEALKKAFWYLDSGCPYMGTRNWLVKKTGRTISHVGLRKLWLRERQ
jgi:hypothetical protein